MTSLLNNIPRFRIAVTVGLIIFLVLTFDIASIAKLASAFQLMMFALICLAVIVMRESRIEAYDPGYHSPFYPWMQIFGIFSPYGRWEALQFCKRVSRVVRSFSAIACSILRTFKNLLFGDVFGENGFQT